MKHQAEATFSVLYVEDDEADVALMERACTTLGLDLHVANCTDDAATVLRTTAAKIAVVVSDISLPGPGGFDLLAKLRNDEATRTLAVYMLTTSNRPKDRIRAKELGANGYFVKDAPLSDTVRSIVDQVRNPASDEGHYLRRELYELIQKDDRLFEFLQEGSLDGVWYWDLETQTDEWMSPRFWRIFGYDPSDKLHLASEWQHMIFPEDLERALDNFHRHAADPGCPYDQVVRYTHQDGSTVWVRCRGLIIRDADGKPIRMLGCHTDVTSLKREQSVLAQRTEELNRSNQEFSDFAHAAAHDLKAPLRHIGAFSNLVLQDEGDRLTAEGRSHLERVSGAAQRLSLMIDRLIEYAELETPALGPVHLAALTKQVVGDFAGDIAAARARVEIEAQGSPILCGDEAQLYQMLQNLLSNALKYRRQDVDPAITVRMAASGPESCELSMQDNGIGFDETKAELIFKPFRRLVSGTQYEGSGIGLATVHKIVTRHGGTIRASSKPGEGSTFVVTLQRARSAA